MWLGNPTSSVLPPVLARGRPATSVTSTRRVPRSGARRENYSTDRNRWQSHKSTCGLSLLWLDPPGAVSSGSLEGIFLGRLRVDERYTREARELHALTGLFSTRQDGLAQLVDARGAGLYSGF